MVPYRSPITDNTNVLWWKTVKYQINKLGTVSRHILSFFNNLFFHDFSCKDFFFTVTKGNIGDHAQYTLLYSKYAISEIRDKIKLY